MEEIQNRDKVQNSTERGFWKYVQVESRRIADIINIFG